MSGDTAGARVALNALKSSSDPADATSGARPRPGWASSPVSPGGRCCLGPEQGRGAQTAPAPTTTSAFTLTLKTVSSGRGYADMLTRKTRINKSSPTMPAFGQSSSCAAIKPNINGTFYNSSAL